MTMLNGRLPAASLASIPGGGRLLAAVAVTWLAICAEVYRLHGWTPKPTGALDSYRPYDGSYYAQVETFLRRYSRTRIAGRPTKVWNGVTYWLRPGQATAAVPGTSNHGWACAVDVTGLGGFDGERYRQFAAAAARFGWTNSEGRSIGEPWHWVDVGNAHLVKNGLTTIGVTPNVPTLTAPTPIEEDPMTVFSPEDRNFIMERMVELQQWLPVMKENTDRLPNIEYKADLTFAASGNITNGVVGALSMLGDLLARDDAGVDEQALAAAVAPLLASPALSDADLARVARAVADEQARRLAV
jgi:hypothetical protein